MAGSTDPFAETVPFEPKHRSNGLLQRLLSNHSLTCSAKQSPPRAAKATIAHDGAVAEGEGSDVVVDALAQTYSFDASHQNRRSELHSPTVSNGKTNLFGHLKQLLVTARRNLTMVAEEEGPRHEPYVDASSHGTGGGIANQDNVNSKSGTDETMDTGDETCYYYMAGSGEVYYVDPNAATQEDGLQMEEEEKEEVAAEREQQAEEGNLELAECQGEKGVEGDEEDEQQFIEGAQNEKDQGHREEQNEKEYQEQIMIKGKVVKALVREESKARKRLQEDSMLVLADIGRTYRGMARCVTTPAKAEKALRHVAKKLEKEATKQGHAMEAEWKKEVMEINRTFRAEMEAEAKRAKKALKSS